VDASATANVDTSAGTGSLDLNGGLVLGDLSGFHLVTLGRGSLTIPVPEQIQLNQAGQTFLSALPNASGNLSLNGALLAGSFQLAEFRANASVNSGQFTGTLNANTIGNIGRLHLEGSGTIGANGVPSLTSLSARATLGVPGLTLNARGTGTANPNGSLDVAASADLTLFGLPSLHAQGTGNVSSEGYNFQGTFSGAGPLYTSYITGDFSLDSSRGISGRAGIFGLTYSPSLELRDPSPVSKREIGLLGKPANPWNPGGLTIGVSYFSYSQGQLSYISAGFMPDIGPNIISNPRFGITAQFHFNFLGSKFSGEK
jgi:hypothetical protein